MKFQLIDQIIEQDTNQIVAIKNVTSAEEYLADHFPSFPVLPGVMMLETMVQAGRLLLSTGNPPRYSEKQPLIMAEARNIKYGNMVKPGQTLKVQITLKSEKNGQWKMQGIGHVGTDVAVQGKFTLAPLAVPPAPSQPHPTPSTPDPNGD